MTRRERIQFLLTWLALGVLPLALRPLWEPDEARYAEIPREMLALADWLTPRLNGVLYFEKPPLQYWLSAGSMKLFGLHAFAARLPLALASFIAMACAWRLARRLGARDAMWAAFMAATSILGFICGQILTLDALFSAFLVLALTAAVEAVSARFEGKGATGWTLLAYAAVTLAFLTKGLAAPVLLGGALLASLPFAWGSPRLRSALLRTLLHPGGWLLLLVLGAPWFWFVNKANPGHAWFFFIHEHFARYSSTVHAREGSSNAVLDKLYFVGVLALGLLPWLSACVVGLKRAFGFLRAPGPQGDRTPLHRWTVALLLGGFAVPFLFFSLSHSKLPPYILPALVPLMALACALERQGEEVASFRRTGRELLVLAGLFLVAAPLFLKDRSGLPWVLVLGLAFLFTGLWTFRPTHLTGNRWMAALAVSMLLLTLAAQKAAGGGKDVAPLLAQAPRNAQWISFGNYYQGIAFHTGRRVPVVAGTGELAYGAGRLGDVERERWFRNHPRELRAMALSLAQAEPGREVWALADRSSWKELPAEDQALWEPKGGNTSCMLLRLKRP